MIVDLMAALVAHLRSRPAITAIAGQRVFALELPADESALMPRHALVLVPSGGVGAPYVATLALEAQRIDCYSYGPTAFEAARLRRAARSELRGIVRLHVGSVLIHWIIPAGGLMHNRDGQTGWPLVWESFSVMSSEMAAA